MPSLAAVVIVRNEEKNLEACLQTLTWVDEIVVLDSGSSDKTCEIAKRYTPHLHVRADWSGFGVQRQRAQDLVSSEWILMIDADERITPALRESVQSLLTSCTTDTVFFVNRLSYVFGRCIRHSGWYPDWVARLYCRHHARYDDVLVHEKLCYPDNSNVEKLTGDLLHFTYDDLHHYLVKSASYAKAWADQRSARGKRSSITSAITHGIFCFIKMYILRAGFLDGRQGFLLALLSAHSTFAKYIDLWLRTSDSKT